MVDVVDSATRSRMMSGIRGRDTKPEVTLRKYLHARGLRYRTAPKNLPGRPDIVLPKYHAVVFVHGCFWHRHKNCRFAATPSTNADFWRTKLQANVKRDARNTAILEHMGWRVIVVWECEVKQGKYQRLADQIRGSVTAGPS